MSHPRFPLPPATALLLDLKLVTECSIGDKLNKDSVNYYIQKSDGVQNECW